MGYIFEPEIEQIKNSVRARTIGEAESITLREIVGSKIHRALKAYFKSEVERSLQQERLVEVRSKKYPYAIPEVVSLQHQTDLLLIYHYQFNQHEFDTVLDQAVHFTFNFLCRPQFTLIEFLFENQRKMSTSSIERKLEFCADYEYYVLLLKRYFTERGLAEITYEEFKELLKRIDCEVIALHSSLELAKMTTAIIGFVEAGRDGTPGQPRSKTLPVNAAIVFFEDKGLDEIKLRLEYERDHNGLNEIDVERLAKIIEEVRSLTSGQTAGSVTDEVADSNMTLDEPAQINEGTPQHSFIAQDMSVVGSTEQAADDSSGKPVIEVPVGRPDQAVEEHGHQELPELRVLFSSGERKKVLKSLFRKDESEFNSTLDTLNGALTWEDASLILDDFFLAHGIDPQSKASILFTEKVFERYNSKIG